MMSGTVFSLIPPIAAIALALITKEVYLSLMIGILSGALLFTGFHPVLAVETMLSIMGDKIGGNINILLFLSFLGILVSMITGSGASRAYGNWASGTIKSKRGALLATTLLGSVIFVDDYFNCLTVGAVMRPVTDRYHVTRAKLAYVIDATAAPVCIIAPVSSWAAAVGSSLPQNSGIDGFSLFLSTIPFNLYAIFSILFLLFIIIRDVDFGAMKSYEKLVETEGEEIIEEDNAVLVGGRGTVADLLLPIGILILLCVLAMLYTGGILDGVGIAQAFAACDSAKSLALGSFFTLIITFLLYRVRKVSSFEALCGSFPAGIKSMVSAIMILSLAWTLSGVCSGEYLNIGGYVEQMIAGSAAVASLLPVIFFLTAMGLAFSTGTSWGTFGILIPIAAAVLSGGELKQMSFAVAAILAGAVCGDHISPISDTTILASAGAGCRHISHVSTQIPYALCVALCCVLGYTAGGILRNGWYGLLSGFILLAAVLTVVERKTHKSVKNEAE